METLNPWGEARLDPQGRDWQDLCRETLVIATYSWVQRRFLKFSPV